MTRSDPSPASSPASAETPTGCVNCGHTKRWHHSKGGCQYTGSALRSHRIGGDAPMCGCRDYAPAEAPTGETGSPKRYDWKERIVEFAEQQRAASPETPARATEDDGPVMSGQWCPECESEMVSEPGDVRRCPECETTVTPAGSSPSVAPVGLDPMELYVTANSRLTQMVVAYDAVVLERDALAARLSSRPAQEGTTARSAKKRRLRVAAPEGTTDAVESLHAAASDLRFVASGGECDPRTLMEHADVLLALATALSGAK